MEFPRLLYRSGGEWQLETGRYALLQVADQAALDAALADGWFANQYAARDALKPTEPADDAPITRAELEQKATELGIKFDGRTGDKKLAALIAEKLG